MKLILTPADLPFEALEKEYLRRKEQRTKEINDRRAHAIEVASRVLANRFLWWTVTTFEGNLLGYAYGTLRHVEVLFPSSQDGYANYVTPVSGGRPPANFDDSEIVRGKLGSQVSYCAEVEKLVNIIINAENESDLPKGLAEEIHDIQWN